MAGGSVGVIDLRTRRKNGEKDTDLAKNPDSGDSFPDSGDIFLRSSEISPDPAKITSDLMRYSQIRLKSHRI